MNVCKFHEFLSHSTPQGARLIPLQSESSKQGQVPNLWSCTHLHIETQEPTTQGKDGDNYILYKDWPRHPIVLLGSDKMPHLQGSLRWVRCCCSQACNWHHSPPLCDECRAPEPRTEWLHDASLHPWTRVTSW
jgi:hypothetical protein